MEFSDAEASVLMGTRKSELDQGVLLNIAKLMSNYYERVELVRKYDSIKKKLAKNNYDRAELKQADQQLSQYHDTLLANFDVPDDRGNVLGHVYLGPYEIDHFGKGIDYLSDIFFSNMLRNSSIAIDYSKLSTDEKSRATEEQKPKPNKYLRAQHAALKKLRSAYVLAMKDLKKKNNLNASRGKTTYFVPKFIAKPLMEFVLNVIDEIAANNPGSGINRNMFPTLQSGIAHNRISSMAFYIMRLMNLDTISPGAKTSAVLTPAVLRRYGLDQSTTYDLLEMSANGQLENVNFRVEDSSPVQVAMEGRNGKAKFNPNDFKLITWVSVGSKGMLNRDELVPDSEIYGDLGNNLFAQFMTTEQQKNQRLRLAAERNVPETDVSTDANISSEMFREMVVETKKVRQDNPNLSAINAFYTAFGRLYQDPYVRSIQDFVSIYPNTALKYSINVEQNYLQNYNNELNKSMRA